MMREKKRLLALLLCLCMVMALQPSGVFALDTDSVPDVMIKGRTVELTGGDGTQESPRTGSIYYAGPYFQIKDLKTSIGAINVYKNAEFTDIEKSQYFTFDNKRQFLYMTVYTQGKIYYYNINVIPNQTNITVNGVDIEDEASLHTIDCGGGTVTFDPAAQTLTLDNATIEDKGTTSGMIDIGAGKDLEIILIGTNQIVTQGKNVRGIHVTDQRKVTISGQEGASLTLNSENSIGIEAADDLAINDAHIEVNSSEHRAIVTNEHLTINNAEITGESNQQFLQAADMEIHESTIEGKSEGASAVWASRGDMIIDHSRVRAVNAIRAGTKMQIINGSDVTATVSESTAISSGSDMEIDNSKVEADSGNNVAVYAQGKLVVNGELSASGKSTSYGAVCALAMTDNKDPNQMPADDPIGIITLGDNYADSNGAGVASYDWRFLQSSQSWCKYFYFSRGGSPAPEVNITTKKPSTPSIPSDYLALERVKAVKDVTEYVDPADYDDTEKDAIKTIISDAKTEIYRAGSRDEIVAAVAAAKEKLDGLQTAKQKEEVARLQRIKKGVAATKIKLSSNLVKKGIRLKWTKSKGFKMDYYEVFRSTKRYSGFGKKAFFTTKNGSAKSYTNTKGLKKGRRYYYKVRGVRILDGEKYYTGYSNKAWRTTKK